MTQNASDLEVESRTVIRVMRWCALTDEGVTLAETMEAAALSCVLNSPLNSCSALQSMASVRACWRNNTIGLYSHRAGRKADRRITHAHTETVAFAEEHRRVAARWSEKEYM